MGPSGAGELRQRVIIQERAAQLDGYGNTVGDWEDKFSRWAKLVPTKGGEGTIAARAQGTALFDCWLHFDSQTRTISTDQRVVDARDRSRTFNIQFAQDMEGRKAWMLLQLQLGGADD